MTVAAAGEVGNALARRSPSGQELNMQVINNVEANQFEARVDDQLAFLVYSERNGVIDMRHTEVPAALEGRGVANELARTALDYAREKKLRVIPTCPFVRSYIRRHPQHADLTKGAGG